MKAISKISWWCQKLLMWQFSCLFKCWNFMKICFYNLKPCSVEFEISREPCEILNFLITNCRLKLSDMIIWLISLYEVVGGGILVSLRPSVRLSICPSVSTSHIQYSSGWIHFIFIILSSNFKRCVACKVSCKISNFWQSFKTCNFVYFWLGIWCESLVWVIMGWQGVSQNAGVLVVLV